MSNRKPMSKKVRFEIFKRDSFTCQYCGKSAPEVVLHVDHITPISKGGEDDITNLITACQSCNLGKSNIEIGDYGVIEKRKKQLDELQERREQLEMMYEWQKTLLDIDQDATDMVCILFSELIQDYSINEKGKNGIKKLVVKYGVAEVIESLKISATQYLEYDNEKPTRQSVQKVYDYVEKICRNRRKIEDKPYLAELYKITNIVKYKSGYLVHWRIMNLLEQAYHLDAGFEKLDYIARNCTCGSDWEMKMYKYIEKLERENG